MEEAQSKADLLHVLFEDNHVLVVVKPAGVPSQPDATGDPCITDIAKQYLKEKYFKPGNVYCGLPHRIDRPVGGVLVLAKTSKAMTRLSKQFQERTIRKRYRAICQKPSSAPKDGLLVHWLRKNTKQNKSYVAEKGSKDAKEARLSLSILRYLDRYVLVDVVLETGRHHQIRAQLSALDMTIKGDVKYGARRPNPDKSISLWSYLLAFSHPTTQEVMEFQAPFPQQDERLWVVE